MAGKRTTGGPAGRVGLVKVSASTSAHKGAHSHSGSTAVDVGRLGNDTLRVSATRVLHIGYPPRRFDAEISAEVIVRVEPNGGLKRSEVLKMASGPLSLISFTLAQLTDVSLGVPIVTEPFVARDDAVTIEEGVVKPSVSRAPKQTGEPAGPGSPLRSSDDDANV